MPLNLQQLTVSDTQNEISEKVWTKTASTENMELKIKAKRINLIHNIIIIYIGISKHEDPEDSSDYLNVE